jgi:thymidine phosphorylase
MMAPSADLAPADRRMYATRDISGTVESIPLITSSILSKKLAEGIDGLVMDVKVGRASFMRAEHDAKLLMEAIVGAGCAAGVRTTALMTDMDHPLGLAIGNALEVVEVLRALDGREHCPADLREVTLALGAEMLVVAGAALDAASATATLERLWDDGVVKQVFAHNLELQGGDPRALEDPDVLGRAPVLVPVPAPRAGAVMDVDPLALGHLVVDLGGGRASSRKDRFRVQGGLQAIDPHVGVVLQRVLGDEVGAGEPLAFVHARSEAAAADAAERVTAAMPVGDERRSRGALIRHRLG